MAAPTVQTSFLPLNSTVSLDELERGMIIQSGNDAAIALAEHVAGSEQAFTDLMNSYAKKIGMNNSHFVNPHGLSAPEHYSTARDLALLGRAMIRDFPETYAYNKIRDYTVNGILQHNRNGLLWRKTRRSTASRPAIPRPPAIACWLPPSAASSA